MNGQRARRLRQMIFGTMSRRSRAYLRDTRTGAIVNHPSSPRAVYQRAKRGR